MKTIGIMVGVVLALQSCGNRGGMDAGGGDGDALEFKQIGLCVATELESFRGLSDNGKGFEEALNDADISFVRKQLYIEDAEVGAKNFPEEGLIVVNRAHWQSLKSSPELKQRLVIHEVLGLMKVGDHGYRISASLPAQKQCWGEEAPKPQASPSATPEPNPSPEASPSIP